MRDWHLGTGLNRESGNRQDQVTLVEAPTWVLVSDKALDKACALTKHTLCGGVEWVHHVPLSRKRDADGYLEKTLGSFLYAKYTDAVFWLDARQKRLVTLPITREQTATLDASVAAEWEDLYSESE